MRNARIIVAVIVVVICLILSGLRAEAQEERPLVHYACVTGVLETTRVREEPNTTSNFELPTANTLAMVLGATEVDGFLWYRVMVVDDNLTQGYVRKDATYERWSHAYPCDDTKLSIQTGIYMTPFEWSDGVYFMWVECLDSCITIGAMDPAIGTVEDAQRYNEAVCSEENCFDRNGLLALRCETRDVIGPVRFCRSVDPASPTILVWDQLNTILNVQYLFDESRNGVLYPVSIGNEVKLAVAILPTENKIIFLYPRVDVIAFPWIDVRLVQLTPAPGPNWGQMEEEASASETSNMAMKIAERIAQPTLKKAGK